jgi:hypothetical protein
LPQWGTPAATVRSGHWRQIAIRPSQLLWILRTPIFRNLEAALLAAARDSVAKTGDPKLVQPKQRFIPSSIGRSRFHPADELWLNNETKRINAEGVHSILHSIFCIFDFEGP